MQRQRLRVDSRFLWGTAGSCRQIQACITQVGFSCSIHACIALCFCKLLLPDVLASGLELTLLPNSLGNSRNLVASILPGFLYLWVWGWVRHHAGKKRFPKLAKPLPSRGSSLLQPAAFPAWPCSSLTLDRANTTTAPTGRLTHGEYTVNRQAKTGSHAWVLSWVGPFPWSPIFRLVRPRNLLPMGRKSSKCQKCFGGQQYGKIADQLKNPEGTLLEPVLLAGEVPATCSFVPSHVFLL